jgi:hypothetical protein
MLLKTHAGISPERIGAFRISFKVFIFLSVFALSFSGIPWPPAPGVVAEIRLNEGTGTIAADASGNGYNGTLVNGPTWGTGKYGQGLNLDGVNDYVNIADNASFTLTPTVSYTWSGWVRNNNFNQWATVWSQTLSTSSYFYFYAHTSSDGEAGPVTNGISVYWYSGTNKLVIHSNNNVLTAGQWSYVAVTYDAAQAQSSRFTIYVNGTDVTNRADVVSSGTIAAIDPTNIRVGSNQPYGEYLNGSVDELRYYRRLLSVAEIQSDMNIGNAPDTETPAVSITAPAAGNVSGTINVSATATDNVAVSGVQFQLDGVNLGAEDIVAPYSVSWNTTTATNGTHNITAKARDAAGNITTSSLVAVNVNNFVDVEGPSVNITAPAAGNVLGTINVTANAADNVAVSGVQFLLDGANLGAEDITAPYSVSWNTTTTSNGNHSITARARDAAGNITTSAAVAVTVNNFVDTEIPTVAITAPAPGNVSGTINVTANAGDNVGVSGVQFLLDGVSLGTEDLTAPYSVSWNTSTTTSGNHILTARARDAAGNLATSTGVTVTVANSNLVAAFGFNENTGTTANDNSGNNNTGTLTNGPLWSGSGKYGAAVLFDGTNDFVNINDANNLDLSGGMTIEAWVNPSNLSGYKTAICKERGAANLAYALSPNNGASGDANQRPNSRIRIGTTTRTVTGPAKLALNTWTHIACTYDGAMMRFYVNGVQVSTFATTGSITASTNPLRIGGTTALAQYFAGLIDEVRIYNIALTQAQIQTDMNTPIAPDVTSPAVNITAPAAGNATGTINVTANATDNISVSGVQFLLNGNNLGAEDLTAPYSISWNTTIVPNGSYTLTARARDAAGNATTSAGVVVTVNNDTQPPAVTITAPAAGTVDGTVNVDASATDNTGVAGVQFLLNGVNLGAEDLTAPYSISWNTTTIADGNYTLTAKARDAAGNITTSSPVVVNVLNNPPDIELPTVNITAPVAGEVAGSVSVTADAGDNVAVIGVQFLLNGVNLGIEDLTVPYSVSWNTISNSNGNYTLTAKARDAAGNITTSAGVIVTVNNLPDTEGPVVAITAPSAGTISGTVNITASASDNTAVSGVQFVLDGNNLGAEDLTFPYSFSWNTSAVSNGTHTIAAKARDAAGNISTSANVVVSVNNDIQAPAVNITSPVGGTVSGTINITANASDNVGVSGVQFLLNGSILGAEDLTSPYTISWNTGTATNGAYTLSARARDVAGNITTSAVVAVTVSNVTNLITALHFNEGTSTVAADVSGKNHNGTLTGGATWTAGKYGQAVNLNGSSNYVNISDHTDYTLDPTQNYTWSAWVKNNNFNEWSTIWSQTLNNTNFVYFYAHTTSQVDGGGGPVTNGVSAYWFSGTGKLALHSNNNVLVAGQWSHITITYNASQTPVNRFTIYVNGADVTNRTAVGLTGTLTGIDPTNIRIGSNQVFGEYLNGSIDEVRYYNRLLTPAEIQADMNTAVEVDNIAPTVNITAPLNAAGVSGIVNVAANAADNVGVAGVQFLLDGVNLGAEDLTAPYSTSWNTETASNGNHTLTARARDAVGNQTTSDLVMVNVGPDFSATLTTPTRNVEVSGTTDFRLVVAYLNGFTSSSVALSFSGLPATMTGHFLLNPMSHQGETQLFITTSNANPGTYNFTITAVAEGITHSQQATLVVTGATDFSLQASPAIQNVTRGNPVAFTINLNETNDFVNPVTLSVLGLPAGASASFNPSNPIPATTSVLTISTTGAAALGTYNLTVQGVSGAITRTIPITLTITDATSVWTVVTMGSTGVPNNTVRVGHLKPDGLERVYVGTIATGRMLEYSWNGSGWSGPVDVGGSPSGLEIHNCTIGPGRGDGKERMYVASYDFNIYEIWNDATGWHQLTVGNLGGNLGMHTVVGDGRNDGVTRLYAASTQQLFEFTWNGTSWTKLLIGSAPGAHELALGNGRRDGLNNVYISSISSGNFEARWNGTAWTITSMGDSGDARGLELGDGRNDGIIRVYSALFDGRIREFTWNGTAWTFVNMPMAGTQNIHAYIVPGRNDGINRVYTCNANGKVFEYSWNGATWDIYNMGGGSDYMYGLHYGTGRNDGVIRFYGADRGSVNRVYEFTWTAPSPLVFMRKEDESGYTMRHKQHSEVVR